MEEHPDKRELWGNTAEAGEALLAIPPERASAQAARLHNSPPVRAGRRRSDVMPFHEFEAQLEPLPLLHPFHPRPLSTHQPFSVLRSGSVISGLPGLDYRKVNPGVQDDTKTMVRHGRRQSELTAWEPSGLGGTAIPGAPVSPIKPPRGGLWGGQCCGSSDSGASSCGCGGSIS